MANGNFAGGDGTENSPYLIEDALDLDAVRNDLSAHYKLINDIDLDVAPFNEGEGWVPIGDDTNVFRGSFDGDNKVIFNLFINRPSSNNQGLFGYANGSTIKNIGLENIDIKGNNYTGGLAGRNYNSSVIENSYSTGSVIGDAHVGGLVGYNLGSSVIENSYSTGSVTGDSNTGGLVGSNSNSAVIKNSYSTGSVTGSGSGVGGLVGYGHNSSVIENSYSTGAVTGSGSSVGGLVGNNLNSTVINSFWDTQTSGQATSEGGTGLTTTQMKDPSSYTNWNFDFTWKMSESHGYPELAYKGSGTEQDPYLISTPDDLNAVRNDLNAHYKLINDIDLDIAPFNTGEGWEPIGEYGSGKDAFRGTLDGGGFVVKNLYISTTKESVSQVGLIGASTLADITNIGIVDVDITFSGSSGTGAHVGGLVGRAQGSVITGCYSTGNISSIGLPGTGGLIGQSPHSSSTIVRDSFSNCNVTGTGYTGGLVGQLTGNLINCYATGNVTAISGSHAAGGLAGRISEGDELVNCYATGLVSGVAGGLIGAVNGDIDNVSVVDSFWDVETTGQLTTVGGGTGLTTAQMKSAQTFLDAGWDEEFLDDATTRVWQIKTGVYPVLWYEELPFLAYRLVEDGDDIKSYDGDSWSVIGVKPVTKQMFLDHGMVSINAESLQALGSNSKLLYWTDVEDAEAILQSTRIPKPVLVKPTGDIDITAVDSINYCNLVVSESGQGKLRVITSVDSGATWKSWDGTAWISINADDLDDVESRGMTVGVFNSLLSEWNALRGGSDFIRFAYYLSVDSLEDVAATDKLTLNVDMKSPLMGVQLGEDYTYQYTSNVELEVTLLKDGDYKINY